MTTNHPGPEQSPPPRESWLERLLTR
jgi:hypothetical protein